jgi:S1-C subfamily serine protease
MSEHYGAESNGPDAALLPRHRTPIVAGAAALVAAAVVAGVAVTNSDGPLVSGSGSMAQVAPAMDQKGSGKHGSGSNPGSGPDGASATGTASSAQQVGVVDVNTVLKYQRARAAGTGMVLSSSGEIVTNNHVIAGATSISVQVVSTGKTYTATVVGTAPSRDIAVLQLRNASGLQLANLGTAANLAATQVGATVTGVGNAGGTGGVPSAATGTVLALNQSLTATDENGQHPERLTGMIETDAAIAAGDSGGPLYDSADHVIGMDTAASTNRRGTTVGFAIPITTATAIAGQIEAGQASASIHLGYPGFLGVSATDTSAGAGIESVLAGGPAANAGIVAGDVVTAVGGTSINSASALSAALAAHDPGEAVSVTWLDAGGQTHHAVVTLGTGPAD